MPETKLSDGNRRIVFAIWKIQKRCLFLRMGLGVLGTFGGCARAVRQPFWGSTGIYVREWFIAWAGGEWRQIIQSSWTINSSIIIHSSIRNDLECISRKKLFIRKVHEKKKECFEINFLAKWRRNNDNLLVSESGWLARIYWLCWLISIGVSLSWKFSAK